MKHYYLFLLLLSIAFLPSCKKCYSCTFPTNICYTCTVAGYPTGTDCSADYTAGEIANFKTSCLSGGGVISYNDATKPATQQCFQSGIIASINISDAQSNCEASGGIWSLK